MYKEANKRACELSIAKSKIIETVHYSPIEKRSLCKKVLASHMKGSTSFEAVTCNVCRGMLGLPKIIISKDSYRFTTATEERLKTRLFQLNKEASEVRDQITLTQMLLDAEIESIRLSVKPC